MAKKQAKGRKQMPNRRRKPRTSYVRASNSINAMTPSMKLACTIDKPFECSACIPDGTKGLGCFSVKGAYDLVTGAAGSCALFAFQPDARSNVKYITNQTAATPVISGSWIEPPSVATIANLYKEYRPVSAGVRFSYTGPTQTDGGSVMAGLVDKDVPLSTFGGLTYAQASTYFIDYKIWPLRNGCEVTWRPGDPDSYMQLKPIDIATTAVGANVNQNYILIFIAGCGSSQAVGTLETIVNFEGRFANTTFLTGGNESDRLAMVEPGWYEKAAAYLRNTEIVRPLVGALSAGVQGYKLGGFAGAGAAALGYLANGLLAPGQVGSSRYPKAIAYR